MTLTLTPKVYPICTIRSTPDKPVHCIVWAKECFKLLFGVTSESMLFEDPDRLGPGYVLIGFRLTLILTLSLTLTLMLTLTLNPNPDSGEASTYMGLVKFHSEIQKSPKDLIDHGCALLTALYSTEVEKRIDMGIYKTAKTAPKVSQG
jgi:hypothetical protein